MHLDAVRGPRRPRDGRGHCLQGSGHGATNPGNSGGQGPLRACALGQADLRQFGDPVNRIAQGTMLRVLASCLQAAEQDIGRSD